MQRNLELAQFTPLLGILILSQTSSTTRTETSAERMLWEQLAAEQESPATLIDQVDELKRNIEKTKRELEEYKKRQ